MGLYGNIKKIGSAAFQFDRKYPNRHVMDNNAAIDKVYAGRYVLVEYGYRFGKDDNNIVETVEGSAMASQQVMEYVYQSVPHGAIYDSNETYYFLNSDNEYVQYTAGQNIDWNNYVNSDKIFKKVQKLTYHLINTKTGTVQVDGIIENEDFRNNANEDLRYYGAIYDSTVWQKVFVNGQDKYVMVAELNAMAPKLDITKETPLSYNVQGVDIPNYRTNGVITGRFNERGELTETVRLTNVNEVENVPYFDTALDTELTYLMHIPTTLKLELNNDTVDFNENGFNMAYSYPDSEGVSTIAWIPKGHDEEGNPIYLDNYDVRTDGTTDNAGNPYATVPINNTQNKYAMDTKMLFMSFPALGNAMNAIYNLIYGKPDPLDDLEHGAMRPYFKRYLGNLELTNRVTVKDRDGSSHFITYNLTGSNVLKYATAKGKVGQTVDIGLNDYDAVRAQNLEPYDLIEIRFKDDNSELLPPGNYYTLTSIEYNNLPKNSSGIVTSGGQYVFWDRLRGQPLSMTIHAPTGDEDPDMDWLKQVPQLADILSNSDSGLATVLSSIFGTVDPLTGTSKYFLYNDWTMNAENSGSGPAIINKPEIIGGYPQTFSTIHANESNKNVLGGQIYDSPGYMINFATSTTTSIETIPYPHVEVKTSEIFSGGDYNIDFDNWQLVNYTTKDIPCIVSIISNIAPLVAQQDQASAQQNQENIKITRKNNTITFSSTATLNSFNENGSTGQWVNFDIDTGFSSIKLLTLNGTQLNEQYEHEMTEKGLEKGHILIPLKADTIRTTPYTVRIEAAGFNTAEITFQYIGVVR